MEEQGGCSGNCFGGGSAVSPSSPPPPLLSSTMFPVSSSHIPSIIAPAATESSALKRTGAGGGRVKVSEGGRVVRRRRVWRRGEREGGMVGGRHGEVWVCELF